MTSAPRRARRRSIGSLLAGALAAAIAVSGLGLAPEARSVPGIDFTRLSGPDRYATAAAVATNTFGSATFALLVSGENFADAVSSSYLAGVSDAPILLSRRDQVPATTMSALQALSVDFVVVVGGPDALAPSVLTQLTAAGFPNARVSGPNRYETAKAVSFVTGAPTVGSNEAGRRTAILSSGQAFPDALAAGPIAYDDGFPLLLTEPGSLHPAAAEALSTLQIQHVLITGGPSAIGGTVEQQLTDRGLTFERLQGPDRYATAQAIATKAVTALGHSDAHVDIATGDSFPDALSGGPHAGQRQGIILLTPRATAGPAACAFLDERADAVTSGHVLGGEAAVLPSVETALEACAAGDAGPGPQPGADPNIDFPVTSAADQVVSLGGATTWTFSAVGTIVDVALVPCHAVTRGSVTTFADDPVAGDGAFPPDSHDGAVRRTDHLGQSYRSVRLPATVGAARIVGVNGAVAPTAYVDQLVAPAGGSLAVTVSAAAADCAVPVVFADPADDDVLQLDTADRPTDPFGVGGAAVFTAGEAPEDTPILGELLYRDEAQDFVVLANGFRYDYGDAGDTYRYGGFSILLNEFEIALSDLDALGVVAAPVPYNRTDANRFDLGVDYAGRVTGVVATFGDLDDVGADSAANDAQVTFVAAAPPDGLIVDHVVDVYRCAPACTLVRSVFDSDHEPASAPVPPNQDTNNDSIDDDVDRRVIVEDLQAGNYRFVVSAITFATQRSLFGSDPSALLGSAAAPGSPRSTSATFTEAAGANGLLGPGDTLFATFDEAMAPPQSGDQVTVRDSAGSSAVLIHGTNATFAVVGSTLSIRVDAEVGGGVVTLVGLQAIASSGVTDPGGLEWDIPGSSDRTFG